VPRFVLLITDLTAVHNEIACHAGGIRFVIREPHQLTRHDWDSAALVLVDAQTAPILRARPQPLPHRDAVTLLVDPEDKGEPDMYRHALDLGAYHLITVPDGASALRKQISMMADSPRMVVAILDPAPTGEAGAITTACLALAGAAAGEHLGLLDARRSGVDLHEALTGTRFDPPAAGRGSVHALFAPDEHPPPGEAIRQMMTDLAHRHVVTLVNLDPHQPHTRALLDGLDLVIVLVSSRTATGPTARDVVSAARRHTPHVHVHITGADLHGDVAEAIAAGAGAGYPSMSASARSAVPGESGHWSAALADCSHHRRLWEVIDRHRPGMGRPT